MNIPLSWLSDFVELTLPPPDLAARLTLAGLEVEGMRFVGLPIPEGPRAGHGSRPSVETQVGGLAWDPERIVVGEILEVMPHPQADRLVLAQVNDGAGEHTVVTGAPNLFSHKGRGALERPLKIAYAREGARLYDGHKPGQEVMTLQRAKIRGVESASMACSEKELGISDEHEGVILLDDDAPVGRPLAEYMGDVVLEISLTPNMARNTCVLGVARELAALTGARLRPPDVAVRAGGPSISGRVRLDIRHPDLNPRFVVGLIEGVRVGPSPYWVQRRLRLAGMRPINNLVDATNYAMLEVGQPLHAFDYDALARRAGGKPPTIITRLPESGERLTTLDGVERPLEDFTVLVADTAGALSIAGVMGGAETEVTPETTTVLLEGAAWNMINIRRTLASQRLSSEAAFRFSRGVHPALAEVGVRRGLAILQQLAGGVVADGLVDAYPDRRPEPVVQVRESETERWLGVRLTASEMAGLLGRLEFETTVQGDAVQVQAPPHRLDIGQGMEGVADVMEEIARVYGYDRIPDTLLSDSLPPQIGNPAHEREEQLRDRLVVLGLQEVISYRLTTPEREARLQPEADAQPVEFLHLANPIASDRTSMRRSVLASVLEAVASNARQEQRLAIFELGPVFEPRPGQELPGEPLRLAVALRGPRGLPTWESPDTSALGFFDVKGIVEALATDLHLSSLRWETGEHPSYHPAKCARVWLGDRPLGWAGELHPLVARAYDLPAGTVAAADLDAQTILDAMPDRHSVTAVPEYPPVLEDVAVVVDEAVPAGRVEDVIRRAGGESLASARLFDVYRGDPVPEGKKSLAFALVYQAVDRTLTDAEAARIRAGIVRELQAELGASLRA